MTDGNTAELPPFQHVLDEHGPTVWRFLCARVGRDDAADRYQETMLAALRAYPDLTHATNLGGWLLTIARRKLIDGWRAGSAAPVPVGDPPETATPPVPTADPSLWSEVRALPPGQRDAIALRYGADLAYREIGHLLDCSEAAARQRVRAGLERLREHIPAPDGRLTEEERP